MRKSKKSKNAAPSMKAMEGFTMEPREEMPMECDPKEDAKALMHAEEVKADQARHKAALRYAKESVGGIRSIEDVEKARDDLAKKARKKKGMEA